MIYTSALFQVTNDPPIEKKIAKHRKGEHTPRSVCVSDQLSVAIKAYSSEEFNLLARLR